METTLNQRFRIVLKSKKWSVNKFAKETGISQSTLSSQLADDKSSVSTTSILAMLTIFPYLSAEWLMRGVGDFESRGYRDDKGTEIHIDASGDHVQGDNNITHSTINQAPSEELIELRVENKLLKEQVSDLRKDKDNLTKLLLK